MKIESIEFIEISKYGLKCDKFDFGNNKDITDYLNKFDTKENYNTYNIYTFKSDSPIHFGYNLTLKEKERESKYLTQLSELLIPAEQELVFYYGKNFSNIFSADASRRRANLEAFRHARYYDIQPKVYKITVEKGDLFYPISNGCRDYYNYEVFLGEKPNDLKIIIDTPVAPKLKETKRIKWSLLCTVLLLSFLF